MTDDKFPDAFKDLKADTVYDRDNFAKFMGNYSDLREYLKAFTEDSNDPNARENLCGLLYPGLEINYEKMPIDFLRDASHSAYTHSQGVLGGRAIYTGKEVKREKGHVEKNLEHFIRELSGEQFFEVIQRLPLYKTDNDELDKVIGLITDIQRMSAAARQQGGIESYVAGLTSKLPEWMRIPHQRHVGNPDYSRAIFDAYYRSRNHDLEVAVTTGGEINKPLLERVFKESIETAEREYKKETNSKDQVDIFELAIRPYYLALADALYPQEKKEHKKEKDPDREERVTKRKALGMPV